MKVSKSVILIISLLIVVIGNSCIAHGNYLLVALGHMINGGLVGYLVGRFE